MNGDQPLPDASVFTPKVAYNTQVEDEFFNNILNVALLVELTMIVCQNSIIFYKYQLYKSILHNALETN